MKAMTAKEFDSLQQRDFENGAVKDGIRIALEELEQHGTTVTREWVIKWREKLLLRGLDRDIGELSIEQICEELGVEVEE